MCVYIYIICYIYIYIIYIYAEIFGSVFAASFFKDEPNSAWQCLAVPGRLDLASLINDMSMVPGLGVK